MVPAAVSGREAVNGDMPAGLPRNASRGWSPAVGARGAAQRRENPWLWAMPVLYVFTTTQARTFFPLHLQALGTTSQTPSQHSKHGHCRAMGAAHPRWIQEWDIGKGKEGRGPKRVSALRVCFLENMVGKEVSTTAEKFHLFPVAAAPLLIPTPVHWDFRSLEESKVLVAIGRASTGGG